MHIQVLPYSADWPVRFAAHKSELESLLHDTPYITIEHVGSTSVPGLAAKPVIDIDIVAQRDQVDGVIAALTQNGRYEYRGELGIPDRHMFRGIVKGAGEGGSDVRQAGHNLYCCVEGSQPLRNHLIVRDLCRGNAEIRDEYGRLKLELTKREWDSLDHYCAAKSELVSWMLEQGGMARGDVDQVAELSEFVRNDGEVVGRLDAKDGR